MAHLFSLYLLVAFALVAASRHHPKCPKVCRPGKLAKKECRRLFYGCSLRKCHYYVGKQKKKGRMCTDKIPLPPPPKDCTEICTTKKLARKACRGLYHKCIVKPCDTRPHYGQYNYKPQYQCTKIAPIEVAPSLTPSPTPSHSPLCQVCPSDEFLTPHGCRCVNHACDACPNGTVCRAAKKPFLQGAFDFPVVGRSGGPNTVYICVSCECGYCDASGDKCCGMYGANCVADGGALSGQCKYDMFDLLGNNRPGRPAGYNVCTPAEGEVLGAGIAADMVNTCGCVPNNKKPCVVKRNYGYTNCRIPRL